MRYSYPFSNTSLFVLLCISLFNSSCENEPKIDLPGTKSQYLVEVQFDDINNLDLTTLLEHSQWIPLKDKNINSVSQAGMGASFFTVFNESHLNEMINIVGFDYQGKSIFEIDYNHPFVPNIGHIDDLRILNDTLILLHRTAERLIYLNKAGEYSDVNPEVITGNAFLPLSNHRILFYSDSKDYHPVSRRTGNAFYVFDSHSQKSVYSFAPFPPVFENMGLAIVPTPIFKGKAPNTALCTLVGQDTIYEVKADSYHPKYFVQFPNSLQKKSALDQLNRDYLALKGTNRDRSPIDREALDLIMNPNYLRAIDFVQEFENYLLLVYSYGTKKRYLSIYNKANGQCVTKSVPSLWNMYQNRFFQGDEDYIILIASDPETLFENEPDLHLPKDHIPEPGNEANPIVFKIPLEKLVQTMLAI